MCDKLKDKWKIKTQFPIEVENHKEKFDKS